MLCLVNAGIKDIPPCELIFLWFGLLYENILIVDTTKLVKDEKRDLVQRRQKYFDLCLLSHQVIIRSKKRSIQKK